MKNESASATPFRREHENQRRAYTVSDSMKLPASSKSRLRAFLRDGQRDAASLPSSKTKRKPGGHLREYRAWLWPHRWAILLVFILATITTALNMAWPYGLKHVMDLLPS